MLPCWAPKLRQRVAAVAVVACGRGSAWPVPCVVFLLWGSAGAFEEVDDEGKEGWNLCGERNVNKYAYG